MQSDILIQYINREMSDRKIIFYTLSGAHLYGFPSEDSDYDIRGCHSVSAREYCGLRKKKDFIEKMDGDFDFVSFDIRKELNLVLKNNSNVLEHIFAEPLITEPEFTELKKIAGISLSKKIYEPYNGLAVHHYRKYISSSSGRNDESRSTVKKYLYILRSLMAGIYALDNGRIEPDICKLNQKFAFPLVEELISLKVSGNENRLLTNDKDALDLISILTKDIEVSKENSSLPDNPPEEAFERADQFLLKCRGLI
ncbi:MAG: nucleotidyltransferase domain-containing protein [Methanomicrobiaceae archaeon]|nr:nucleotidyltransferase domain-containing protein [Methanomicrobiaceae archaeon]